MKKIVLATAAVAALITGQAWSATGNDLMQWLPEYESDTASWASGMYLGFVSGVASATNGVLYCSPKATNGQNAAIVAKFLKNNPERWTEDAAMLTAEALQKAHPKCKNT
ncbi:Rap1a/Tai family immunity protein [Pseudomonas sp. NUPR-001]|uniref:Rap1a/Tai family immunity protein n=1 Tax=Pseudomonas sp. NUPR-001 TaxID=3416058 RepID=UPI003F9A1685